MNHIETFTHKLPRRMPAILFHHPEVRPIICLATHLGEVEAVILQNILLGAYRGFLPYHKKFELRFTTSGIQLTTTEKE